MQTVIGFLRDLGWEVIIGILVLLICGPIVYFRHWGETKAEKVKRLARDAARAS